MPRLTVEEQSRKAPAAGGTQPQVPARREWPHLGEIAPHVARRACACGGGCPRCESEAARGGVQPKLRVSTPGDASEREADRIADEVLSAPRHDAANAPVYGDASAEGSVVRPKRTQDAASSPRLTPAAESGVEALRGGGGEPLPAASREFFEGGFGRDFGGVRVHTGAAASASARSLGARAYTVGREVVFGEGEYAPGTEAGRRLLAHELAHVVQQEGVSMQGAAVLPGAPLIQRDTPQSGAPATQTAPAATQPAQPDPLTAPLTDSEWQGIDIWLSRGEVGIDPLTDDADHNADLIAAAIFCERALYQQAFGTGGDPLLCILNDVTIADPRVQALKQEVISRGPIINWVAVPAASRMVYVMELLVDTYHYPVNAAAGIVGNLRSESGVLPSRIEGSAADTPMRSRNFANVMTDFSPDEVMNRNRANSVGPKMPGIGLAQWTTAGRRSGLFQRTSQGRPLGSSILFNMDAQVEYLVSELQASAGLNTSLMAAGVSVNDASDNVVYQFEIPGAVLDAAGNRLPRADPAVQAVFGTRRNLSQGALDAYRAVHPENP
jgi:hypothetical protein